MALTRDRNTQRRWDGRSIVLKVKAATTIYAGGLVAVDSTGYAVPAADTAGHKVAGIADDFVDNSAGASGDERVTVRTGVFKLANNGTNPVIQTTVLAACQVADDQTVRASGGTNSIVAGVVQEIDPDGGIWVMVG